MSLLPAVKNGELVRKKNRRTGAFDLTRTQRRRLRRLEAKFNPTKNKPFVPPSYQDSIKSKYWRDFKISYWKRHPKKCAACGGSRRLTLHHVHYGYLGREEDKHVVPLCWSCHEEFHREYGTATVMIEETNEFIETKQLSEVVARF